MTEKSLTDIIAAARKAAAEGEAIIARTREALGLTTERRRDGPKMLAWMRGEIGRGSPDIEPDYFLTDGDRSNVQAVVTMLALARATGRPGLRKTAYRDAGVHLRYLRDVRDKPTFLAIVKHECGLGKNRAYAIMARAGTNLVEQSDSWLANGVWNATGID